MKQTLITLMLLLLCPAVAILADDDGGDGHDPGGITPPPGAGQGKKLPPTRRPLTVSLGEDGVLTIIFLSPEGEAELTLTAPGLPEPVTDTFHTSAPYSILLPEPAAGDCFYTIETENGNTYQGRFQ